MPFSKATLKFLRDLKRNNESEWFKEHRAEYVENVQAPSLEFAAGVLEACAKRGLPFRGDAKKCLFRINRDIRFSKDKSPFNRSLPPSVVGLPGQGALRARDGRGNSFRS